MSIKGCEFPTYGPNLPLLDTPPELGLARGLVANDHDQDVLYNMLHVVELINFKQQPSQNHNTTLQAYPSLL